MVSKWMNRWVFYRISTVEPSPPTPRLEDKRRWLETCLCQTPKNLEQEATWTGNKRMLQQQEADEEHNTCL